jgi:uncharacterized protein
MTNLLLGDDEGTTCTWNSCDPYTTDAVHGVDGQGNRGNCGRTCKEGPFWEKASTVGYERYLSLHATPMAYDGCMGCRFFYACKGHCPGEGLDGDWRAKTEHCETLMGVFGKIEADLVAQGKEPISLSSLLPRLEAGMVELWQQGRRVSVKQVLASVRNGSRVASNDNMPHGDAPHGDHTDVERPVVTHGDHTDVRKTWQ